MADRTDPYGAYGPAFDTQPRGLETHLHAVGVLVVHQGFFEFLD